MLVLDDLLVPAMGWGPWPGLEPGVHLYSLTSHLVFGVAQAGRVDNVQRDAFNLDGLLHHIARGARNGRHNRAARSRDAVEKSGLPDVGPAHEDHRRPGGVLGHRTTVYHLEDCLTA